MRKIFFTLAFLQAVCVAFAGDIEIVKPYAYESIPNAKNAGIFMEIKNKGKKDVKITGGSSSLSDVVEVHTHIKKDGMMQMVKVEDYTIKPKAVNTLKRGSDHIMLMGIKKPLKAGDTIDLTLKFDNNEVVELKNIKVEKRK